LDGLGLHATSRFAKPRARTVVTVLRRTLVPAPKIMLAVHAKNIVAPLDVFMVRALLVSASASVVGKVLIAASLSRHFLVCMVQLTFPMHVPAQPAGLAVPVQSLHLLFSSHTPRF